LVIADSGERGVTSEIVGRIRAQREANLAKVDGLFRSIGEVVRGATEALATGDARALGVLFDENHACLRELGLSTERLEAGVIAAHKAGAFGAKLTGAGAGGCLIAITDEEHEAPVRAALAEVGFALVEARLDPGFFE
jgi:mevalonate kinase